MSAKIYKQLENKYKIEIKSICENKYGNTFINVKDLADKEEFKFELIQGEHVEKSFKRVFGY